MVFYQKKHQPSYGKLNPDSHVSACNDLNLECFLVSGHRGGKAEASPGWGDLRMTRIIYVWMRIGSCPAYLAEPVTFLIYYIIF